MTLSILDWAIIAGFMLLSLVISAKAKKAFLRAWRKRELLRSEGKIDLDVDLRKLRADRDLNR